MTLTPEEQKMMQDIESKYYMEPILSLIRQNLDIRYVLNNLCEYLKHSEGEVRKCIPEGKNVNQALKRIVGNEFPLTVAWIFLQCKKLSLISKDLFISQKGLYRFVDLVIFNQMTSRYIFLFLKTSLRERVEGDCASAKEIKNSNNYSTFFVTPDFYDEIGSCRKNLEEVFDYVFVGKNVQPDNFIKPLGEIVDVVNRLLA
ncbi:MAG: hypothetical protein J6P00_02870 [Acetobacter sp.]|nr:hypothetical protein [Acetobacter sp.]